MSGILNSNRQAPAGPTFAGDIVAGPASAPVSASLFLTVIRLADILILTASGIFASQACRVLGIAGVAVTGVAGEQILITLAATVTAVFALNRMRAYWASRLRSLPGRLRTVMLAVALGAAAAVACLVLMPFTATALLLWPLFWALTAGPLLAAAAAASTRSARALVRAERLGRRVAVVGASAYSQIFITRMAADPSRAAICTGLYADRPVSDVDDFPPGAVLGQLDDLVARSRREKIDAIVLAMPLADLARIAQARAALRSIPADIYLAADVLDIACKTSRMDRLGPNPVIKIARRPLTDWQAVQKGTVDWVLSAVLLAAALPALAMIALAIRLDSAGPILFRQPRLGFNNTLFNVLKFRTMHHHMADLQADRQTTRDDDRITRIGRILRRTSLDEVPQLVNVLRGEMSLVGPRPHALNTKAGDQLFHDAVADYALRHRVKPGITGWAQVNGWRGETSTHEKLAQRVAHDLHYIDNWSMALDWKIMGLTVLREFNSKDAF